MLTSKERITSVFDDVASQHAWEDLYSGKIDRTTYNFVSRLRNSEELLAPVVKGKVLDLGCGTGDLFPFFARKGMPYVGVDLSPSMIERANSRHEELLVESEAEFMTGDCESLPFDAMSFDVVTAIALIEYLPDPARTLDEMSRVLKPGGILYLTVPHKSCFNWTMRDIVAPVRDRLFPLYKRIKGSRLSAMSQVKHYHYDADELDALMAKRTMRNIGEKYSNFYFILHPFDHVLPQTYVRLSEWADRSGKDKLFRRFAVNYLGLYQKDATA